VRELSLGDITNASIETNSSIFRAENICLKQIPDEEQEQAEGE
jgi:hypothetical protein